MHINEGTCTALNSYYSLDIVHGPLDCSLLTISWIILIHLIWASGQTVVSCEQMFEKNCKNNIVHIYQGPVWYYIEALVTATRMTCMEVS